MKAGLEIQAGNETATCTAGYLARLTQQSGTPLVVVTAGHCIYQSTALSWYQGAHVNWIGHEDDYTFSGTDGADIDADVGLIRYGDDAPYNDLLYKNNSSSIGSIRGYITAESQMEGSYVCRMGYGSLHRPGYTAKTCGQIINTGATKESCATQPGHAEVCNWVHNETVVNFDSTGGDSGGPVYQNPDKSGFDPDYILLYGIHTHSVDDTTCDNDASKCKGWFSTVDWARAALIVQFTDNDQIDVCVNSSCTIP